MSELRDAVQRKGSFWQTARVVGWSFFGVRRSSDHESDLQRLNPLHVVLAGVLAALLFIAALAVLVRWVVSSGIGIGA